MKDDPIQTAIDSLVFVCKNGSCNERVLAAQVLLAYTQPKTNQKSYTHVPYAWPPPQQTNQVFEPTT